MPTRRAEENSPIAFEKYMSDPSYVARRAIPANVVAEKAAGYASPADRRLLFFVQALSMQAGGLNVAVEDLLVRFPEAKKAAQAGVVAMLPEQQQPYALYFAEESFERYEWPATLHHILVQFCINPGLNLDALRHPTVLGEGLLRILEQYRRTLIKEGKRRRIITSGGKVIESGLDRVLATGRMGVIEAPAGYGKSNSAQSWCAEHLGEARYASLSGITHRTGFFQVIGKALGLGMCQQASSKLQAKIESLLATAKLMIVFDEAHYLWPQHRRSHSNPEFIDWVDTALVNQGVPVALICTDQIAKLKARGEKQTGWTADQFLHRTFRYTKLDDRPTKADLEAVTRHLLSMRWREEKSAWLLTDNHNPSVAAIKTIVGYAGANPLPLPAVRSIVEEARFVAHDGNGRDIVSVDDVAEALKGQKQSDVSIRQAFAREDSRRCGAQREKVAPALSRVASIVGNSAEQMSRLSGALPANHSLQRARLSSLTGRA